MSTFLSPTIEPLHHASSFKNISLTTITNKPNKFVNTHIHIYLIIFSIVYHRTLTTTSLISGNSNPKNSVFSNLIIVSTLLTDTLVHSLSQSQLTRSTFRLQPLFPPESPISSICPTLKLYIYLNISSLSSLSHEAALKLWILCTNSITNGRVRFCSEYIATFRNDGLPGCPDLNVLSNILPTILSLYRLLWTLYMGRSLLTVSVLYSVFLYNMTLSLYCTLRGWMWKCRNWFFSQYIALRNLLLSSL